MTVDPKKLVAVLKRKRAAEGLSLRGLSSIIGVSFSTLARIERGEGEPDNNSLVRILQWLGDEGHDAGLSFENVAFVHFRAAKNARSKTIHCLLKAADILKRNYGSQDPGRYDKEQAPTASHFPSSETLALSKPEMESMAQEFRHDLGLTDTDPLDALKVTIGGVDVFTPGDVPGLSEDCRSHLSRGGSSEWSAMSVPLDAEEDRWAILRNDQHNPQRQQVTYLEECWHILLGHKLTKISKISDAYGRTYDPNEEHDAFYLASATLLPEVQIRHLVDEKKSAPEIAQTFGVSTELVEYRIKRLGLWRIYKGKEVKIADARNQ